MNRQAIALAADSATTVTEWVGGREQPRFFKGANKIFQLSNSYPVGVMIFGSAQLHEVPWELIIKDFRSDLGSDSYGNLNNYAEKLFDFIKTHPLFPADYQATICKKEVAKTALVYCYYLSQHDSVKNATSEQDKLAACDTLIDGDLRRLSKMAIPPQLTQVDINYIASSVRDTVNDRIKSAAETFNLPTGLSLDKLRDLAIQVLSKEYQRYMTSTGLVVAGFGNKDYFPGYEEYSCFGLLVGTFLFDRTDSQTINVDQPSFIKAFATTKMVDTFMRGCSLDVFIEVNNQMQAALKGLAAKIMNELNLSSIANLEDHIKNIFDEHGRKWFNNAIETHARPLQRVIGSLPVDEMAELAETLIMLESLKEKVTQPTESVGGPIDVAVITKGDGFIWIKRKHYFDPQLNPRFFVRQRGNV